MTKDTVLQAFLGKGKGADCRKAANKFIGNAKFAIDIASAFLHDHVYRKDIENDKRISSAKEYLIRAVGLLDEAERCISLIDRHEEKELKNE